MARHPRPGCAAMNSVMQSCFASTGVASEYTAVLALALYIASGAAQMLYSRHQLMWLVWPILLYWVGCLWLNAHRGKMHHEPLVFTMRDRRSRILIMLMLRQLRQPSSAQPGNFCFLETGPQARRCLESSIDDLSPHGHTSFPRVRSMVCNRPLVPVR